MKEFSWEFITLGLLQLSLLLIQIESDTSLSYTLLVFPSILLAIVKIVKSVLKVLANEGKRDSQKEIVELFTLGLILCSLVFFIEGADNGVHSLGPVTIPIYMIFALHIAIKVYKSPPKMFVSLGNFLFPTMTVCTLNGSCSTVYLSMFSPILTALGVSITDLVAILHPISYILLTVTVISVYKKSEKLMSPPFPMSLIALFLILIGQSLIQSFLIVIVGNLLLVTSVVLADRSSKFEYKTV